MIICNFSSLNCITLYFMGVYILYLIIRCKFACCISFIYNKPLKEAFNEYFSPFPWIFSIEIPSKTFLKYKVSSPNKNNIILTINSNSNDNFTNNFEENLIFDYEDEESKIN